LGSTPTAGNGRSGQLDLSCATSSKNPWRGVRSSGCSEEQFVVSSAANRCCQLRCRQSLQRYGRFDIVFRQVSYQRTRDRMNADEPQRRQLCGTLSLADRAGDACAGRLSG
jgi:hypothetical protein